MMRKILRLIRRWLDINEPQPWKDGLEKKLRKLSERPWMNGLLIVSTLRKIGVKELIIVLNQIVKV
jgi:hypothetical protein